MGRPPLPPFTEESAIQKVARPTPHGTAATHRVSRSSYTADSRWRNRAEFPHGRAEIEAFLTRKWARELDYRLIKELWTFAGNRIAVRFAYEYRIDLVGVLDLRQQLVRRCVWQWMVAGSRRRWFCWCRSDGCEDWRRAGDDGPKAPRRDQHDTRHRVNQLAVAFSRERRVESQSTQLSIPPVSAATPYLRSVGRPDRPTAIGVPNRIITKKNWPGRSAAAAPARAGRATKCAPELSATPRQGIKITSSPAGNVGERARRRRYPQCCGICRSIVDDPVARSARPAPAPSPARPGEADITSIVVGRADRP